MPGAADRTAAAAAPESREGTARAGGDAAAGSGRSRWRRLAAPAVLALLTLAVSAVMFGEAWRDPAASWKGDIGDPEQFQFFLGWVPHALAHGMNPLVTHAALWPAGVNLMWNTAVLLPALLVAPVTAAFGPTVAYNVLMLLAPPAAALAGYAAFRRWAGPAGAAVGGLLLALCPFFVAHAAGHLHLMLLALVPLTLLLADELLIRQRWRWWVTGLLLGGVAAAQLLTAEEVLALEALGGLLAVALLAAWRPREGRARMRYAVRAMVAAVGTFAVLAGYPLWVQFAGPQRVTAAIHAPNWYVNDLSGVVVPAHQWLGGSLTGDLTDQWTGGSAEWNGYLGVPLLLLVVALLLWRGRRPVVWIPATLGAATLVLSFGAHAHVAGHTVGPPLPWAALAHAPLLHQVLPARFGLLTDLFAALLVAVAVDEVLAARRVPVSFAGGLAVGAVLLSWLPLGWPTPVLPQPRFFTASGGLDVIPEGSVAVVLPLVVNPSTEHAEVWQARSGFRFSMPEGYLIVPGPHWGPRTRTYDAFGPGHGATDNLARWLADGLRAEWRRWGVRTVVVGPGPHQADEAAAVAQVLRRPPTWLGGVAVFPDVPADLRD